MSALPSTAVNSAPASERLFTGLEPSPRTQRDKSAATRFRGWMKGLFSFTFGAKPPAKFNWHDQNVVPSPGNQEGLMACVCYASSLAAAICYRLASGKELLLAPRVMHLCTMRLPPENGTNFYDWRDSALDKGVPFAENAQGAAAAGSMNGQAQCGAFNGLPVLKVASMPEFATAEDVKREISSKGPVVVEMTLYLDFWHNYKAGTVYRVSPGAVPQTSHAVCLIGYDDTRECWIGVNSRGPAWGDKGEFLLKYGECDVLTGISPAFGFRFQP